MTGRIYSFDSSGLIDGLERYYPADFFPGLWSRVEDLINEGRLVVSEEVLEELSGRAFAANVWCIERRSRIAVQTDADVAIRVREILKGFPDSSLLSRVAIGRIRL